ncbi:hypothetical protein [Vibrio agarivorans]|uniref:hypothetical protein n=1 Tax=Vibrio agarivorans TaxID=153622 RepID=UPI002231A57C|nr:hypothetical protein [Vibrio agarivorans]
MTHTTQELVQLHGWQNCFTYKNEAYIITPNKVLFFINTGSHWVENNTPSQDTLDMAMYEYEFEETYQSGSKLKADGRYGKVGYLHQYKDRKYRKESKVVAVMKPDGSTARTEGAVKLMEELPLPAKAIRDLMIGNIPQYKGYTALRA